MAELLSCPFCGGEAEVVVFARVGQRPIFFPTCTNCGAELPRVYRTKEQAIEVWNTRAPKERSV